MKSRNYCSCCFTEHCSKDSISEYSCNGAKDIYCDMLRATFDIQIIQEESFVCDRCIARLRDAADFKKQVIESQENIIKLSSIKNFSDLEPDNTDLKVEPLDDYDDDFDDALSGDWSDSDFNWEPMKDDDKGQIFVIKLEEKALKTRKLVNSKTGKNILRTKLAKSKNLALKTEKSGQLKGEKLPKLSQAHRNQTQNTLKLIENSNMCPFKSYKTRFGCFACKATFFGIQDLRKHTSTHMDSKYLATRVKQMRGLTYRNVEISDLKCNICSESVTELNELTSHLMTHKVTFNGTDHFLIPYRLNDGFSCVICEQNFNTFTRLSMHMNTHYTNNVCEICGNSYINRVSLRTHLNSMHKEKTCSLCSAVFLRQNALVRHLRKVHNTRKEKRYCLMCDKSFPYSYLLEEHKIQEHGAKRLISKCGECGKVFNTPQNLKIHVRCVHIKERNYPCVMCGMRFFTKCDQRRHERTHEDVRAFSCSYCDAKFKSKDSCRRHLRRQHGHAFVPDT